MKIYTYTYQPAGFTWEEYLKEPSWVIEAVVAINLEKARQDAESLRDKLPKRRR